jgi:choline dehydrogenase-like flavoprotein
MIDAAIGALAGAELAPGPRLRVRGVGSLRIADGSIIPFLPAINPCITTMMIGEKCADLLKEDAAGRGADPVVASSQRA